MSDAKRRDKTETITAVDVPSGLIWTDRGIYEAFYIAEQDSATSTDDSGSTQAETGATS